MKKHNIVPSFIIYLTIFCLTSLTVNAATLTVSTTTDELDATGTSTGCSLREAIQNINDYASGSSITYTECGSPDGSDDTIILESTENYTITLSDASGDEDNNATGDFDIKGSVTIQADDTDTANISGANTYRVIEIPSGTSRTVSFETVRIESGFIAGDRGACVNIHGSHTVTIEGSTLISCSNTTSTLTQGGAIYINGATLTINNSNFLNNTIINTGSLISAGGGIYARSATLNITNTNFDTNSVNNTSGTGGTNGGGIYANLSTLNISRSSFISNSTNSNSSCSTGGALSAESSTVELSNSTLYQNRSDSSGSCGADGSAIYNNQSTLNINNSTIASNETTDIRTPGSSGGAVHTETTSSVTNIKNTIVADNISNSTNIDLFGPFTSYGYNVIENQTYATASYASGVDSSFDSSTDPSLGTSGTYGGTTTVVEISTGSSAESTGSCTDIDGDTVTIDQRGFLKDDGDGVCDIGAFEIIDQETGAMCEDGIDNDSDGQSDCNDSSDCACSTWYVDSDSDGFGSSADAGTQSYSQPSGYVSNNSDCDDSDDTLSELVTYYPDLDGDSFGDNSHAGSDYCGDPGSSSTNNDDCDDSDSSITLGITYYTDADGDGYGDSGTEATTCAASIPAGTSTLSGDCDETSVNANIGITSETADDAFCSDGIDNDCDGLVDTDDSECIVEDVATIDDPTVTTDPTEATPETTQGESSTSDTDTTETTESGSEAEATSTSSGCQLNPAQPASQASVILLLLSLVGLVRFRHQSLKN